MLKKIRLVCSIGMLAALVWLVVCCIKSTDEQTRLVRNDWAPDVKQNINTLLDTYGGKENAYAVFDFDNTTAIFDIEEQMMIHQITKMAFAMNPEEFGKALMTGLDSSRYVAWEKDITRAYAYLYEKYGPFTPKGVDNKEMTADAMWLEFAAKMGAMYELLCDQETPDVAYDWILYWNTGMTAQEIYDLAAESHRKHMALPTSLEKWTSPESVASELGSVSYEWTCGIQVTENLKELWRCLKNNGIDVWVCSASGVNQVLAAVDVFGLRDYCTGVLAMTPKFGDDGKLLAEYDFETGYAYTPKEGDADGMNGWEATNSATRCHTAGPGKVTAIKNVLMPRYGGMEPLAGFMDSTGDFNFCTEFNGMKLVCCFNRANRSVREGGGLIAITAIYERDVLGYDLAKANAEGNIMYVLQGRDENGLRTLRASNSTLRAGMTEEKLFAGEENYKLLEHITKTRPSVREVLDTYSKKTPADNPLGFAYGF